MSTDVDRANTGWIKSSYSAANGGECVEFSRDFAWVKSSHSDGDGGQCLEFTRDLVHHPHGLVPVRDSKTPNGPAVIFPATGWTSFISAVKRGDFVA